MTDQKGAKIRNIINWVPFVLPLYMMSYTTESDRSLPWPRVHEPWKADTSNPGDGSGESVMSHRTEARLVPVNLSGRPDTSATQRLAARVASHFQAPTLFFSHLTPPPHRFSLNIFTFPDSENTVNSSCDSEGASRVRKMCALYVWCGFLSSGLRQPNCAPQPMWTDAQKRIMHADEGRGVQRDRAAAWKLGGHHCLAPHWWIILSHEGWLMQRRRVTQGTQWHFVVATVEFRPLFYLRFISIIWCCWTFQFE